MTPSSLVRQRAAIPNCIPRLSFPKEYVVGQWRKKVALNGWSVRPNAPHRIRHCDPCAKDRMCYDERIFGGKKPSGKGEVVLVAAKGEPIACAIRAL